MQSTTNSERFRIGPTIDREFWRAGRASLNIDRGPCGAGRSFLVVCIGCMRDASADVHPDASFREESHRLISDYERLVPHLLPPRTPFILWHPDLHTRNIIVTAEPPYRLSGIIDWQGAVVGAYFMQLSIPAAYISPDHPLVLWSDEEVPTLSPEVEALSDDEKRRAHFAYRRAERQKLHGMLMRARDPPLAEEMYDVDGFQAKQLGYSAAVAITRGNAQARGLAFIRKSFLTALVSRSFRSPSTSRRRTKRASRTSGRPLFATLQCATSSWRVSASSVEARALWEPTNTRKPSVWWKKPSGLPLVRRLRQRRGSTWRKYGPCRMGSYL
ncbi:hypothetical protein BV20DRAFT_1079282 [Pilatotrama ljubarskyi]|nr:hypothetical protein BV20DRAFT_1079282 [Pilatotrama ljubarskyi]